MSGNRKAFTDTVLKHIKTIERVTGGTHNAKIYKERLEAMSDEEIEQTVERIERGEFILPFIVPNFSDLNLTVNDFADLNEKMGLSLFTRLRLTDPGTGKTKLTPIEYMTLLEPVKRQSQTQSKGLTVPANNKRVDDLTDQPTGSPSKGGSKGAAMSFQEVNVLRALGLDEPIIEALMARGGNMTAFNLMNQEIAEKGEVSLRDLEAAGGSVKSTDVLAILLKAMNLQST